VSSLKRLSFHLFRVDRLIQLPYGLARPDLERIRRFRRETVKGGLNMRKELEARALRLQKLKGSVQRLKGRQVQDRPSEIIVLV
jgi:hypothetical protein